MAIEERGDVKKRIKDGRKVTIITLSTMKSRWKLSMKSSKAKVDA